MTRLLQALDGFKPLKAMALERSTKSLIEGDIRRLNHALPNDRPSAGKH